MSQIQSAIQTESALFKDNKATMQTLVDDLHAQVAKVSQGGNEKARKRHLEHGKILPRERINQLLDPGSPFLELSQLAATGTGTDCVVVAAPAAGMPLSYVGKHTEMGHVIGQSVYNATVKGILKFGGHPPKAGGQA